MAEEYISVFDFLPELLGVLVGTVIGYLIANRASKLASKKNINLTKIALIDEIGQNKNALKIWSEKGTSYKNHISIPFRKSAHRTAIASGNFAKLDHNLQHALGELYHEIDAFQSFANIIVNWRFATIAINPQGKENYEKFLDDLAISSEFVHFGKKMEKLINNAQEQLKIK